MAMKRGAAARHSIFMCPPKHFGVEYVINPWMRGNVHRPNLPQARRQWTDLHRILGENAVVELIEPHEGVPDLVFTANAGLILERKVILSHFRHPERQREEPFFRSWFRERGFEVVEMPRGMYFEGAGDGLYLRGGNTLVMGYGFRTVLDAATFVSDQMQLDVLPLRLVDERFYHLDTCFCPLRGGYLLYYPSAFDQRSVALIEKTVPAAKRHAVSELDALHFACNAVDLETRIILNKASGELRAVLESWRFEVIETPLSEFLMAGGAAKCLTLRLDEPRLAKPRRQRRAPVESRSIEFSGHFIDSGALTRVMDLVPARGGTFKVIVFTPGLTKEDPSHIVLQVNAPDRDRLQSIILHLLELGGRPAEVEDLPARTDAAPADGVAPADFYVTANRPTDVFIGDSWRSVENLCADGAIVIGGAGSRASARCCSLHDIRKNDKVVVGADGIRLQTQPGNGCQGASLFSADESIQGEESVAIFIDHLAWNLGRLHDRKGRVVFVADRCVYTSGAIGHLSRLVRGGFVGGLVCCTGLASMDIAAALYRLPAGHPGGVEADSVQAECIHAINAARKSGGIAGLVRTGALRGGLFHELHRAKIPYAVIGSVEDAATFPETPPDQRGAREAIAEALRDTELLVLLGQSALTSAAARIASPAVRLVALDKDPQAARKLAERNPIPAMSVAVDPAIFVRMIADKLGLS